MSKTVTAAKASWPADAGPQPTFQHCACGVLVIIRPWHMGSKDEPGFWRELAVPVSAALGSEHTCQAMALAA